MRTCNNEADFNRKVKFFKEKLLTRGYTEKELSQITTRIQHTNRPSVLENTRSGLDKYDKLVFTTSFNPCIETTQLKRALVQHWDKIEQDATLRKLFPEKPLIAYKRNKNLKDTLVRAKLNTNSEQKLEATQCKTRPKLDRNISILASLLEEQR